MKCWKAVDWTQTKCRRRSIDVCTKCQSSIVMLSERERLTEYSQRAWWFLDFADDGSIVGRPRSPGGHQVDDLAVRPAGQHLRRRSRAQHDDKTQSLI